jgi:hypothetical protein
MGSSLLHPTNKFEYLHRPNEAVAGDGEKNDVNHYRPFAYAS